MGEGGTTTISVKEFLAALAESQTKLLAEAFKRMSATQEAAIKTAREEQANVLLTQLQADPNMARFLPAMLSGGTDAFVRARREDAHKQLDRGAGLKYTALARATAIAKKFYDGNMNKIPDILADDLKDKETANAVLKSMNVTDPEGGGFWIKETWASDFVGPLYATAVLGIIGVRPYPMDSDVEHIPGMDASTQAFWVGEGEPILPSDEKANERRLTLKTVGGLLIMSNKLLRSASPLVNEYMRDDLYKILTLAINNAFIQSRGTTRMPLGMKYAGVQSASVGARINGDTMVDLMELLWGQNVPMLSPFVVFNSKLKRDFMRVKTANGDYMYRDEMEKGTIDGCKWAMTTQIPTGGGSGASTDIYVGDASEIFYANRGGVGFNMQMSTESSYQVKKQNGDIVTRSLLQNLETGLLATLETDFAYRHKESVVTAPDVNTVDV